MPGPRRKVGSFLGASMLTCACVYECWLCVFVQCVCTQKQGLAQGTAGSGSSACYFNLKSSMSRCVRTVACGCRLTLGVGMVKPTPLPLVGGTNTKPWGEGGWRRR